MKAKLTAASLHPQARGRWLSIFQYMCPGMFDDAISNLGTHVTCPFHGGENDFRFIKTSTSNKPTTAQCGVAMCTCGFFGDGFAVLHRAMGGRFFDVLRGVDEYLNGSRSEQNQRQPRPKPIAVTTEPNLVEEARIRKELLGKVNGLWQAGHAFKPNITRYYSERGIALDTLSDLQDIRTVNSLGYYIKENGKPKKTGSFPAILAVMRDPAGNPVAVHRTWLSQDQTKKADVQNPKKLTMSPGVAGAAIRLFNAKEAEVLGLAEGIETALGVRQLLGNDYWPDLKNLPVWACFAGQNIRNFQIPPELLKTLKKIIVFADNDENGTGSKAAAGLKERMAKEYPHILVETRQPAVAGLDWLDVLVNQQ